MSKTLLRLFVVVIRMGFSDMIVGHWRCGGGSYLPLFCCVAADGEDVAEARKACARKREGGNGGRRDAETEEEIGGAREENSSVEADAAEAV